MQRALVTDGPGRFVPAIATNASGTWMPPPVSKHDLHSAHSPEAERLSVRGFGGPSPLHDLVGDLKGDTGLDAFVGLI